MSVLLAACTRGTVVDPDNNDTSVDEALVELFSWPHDTDPNNPWPAANTSSYPVSNYEVTTSSTNIDGFNWAITQHPEGCYEEDGLTEDVVLESTGHMFRFRIDKEGYDPSFYYEFLPGAEECTFYDCPGGGQSPGSCRSFDTFELLPENPSQTHDLLPDIMIDPRVTEDDHYFQCVQVPEGGNKIQRVGLRASVSTANVGAGDFHLEWNYGTEKVEQHIHRTSGSSQAYPLDDVAFEYHSGQGHHHFHVKDWSVLRILEDLSSCDQHPDDRGSGCVVREGEKISFCLVGNSPFDNEIFQTYGNSSVSYGCFHLSNPQGFKPGEADVYGSHLEGQAINLGNIGALPTPGDYLLEAQHDPEGHFLDFERTPSNNAARISITIPEFTTDWTQDSCTTPNEVLDCRDFSETNLNPHQGMPQSGHCRDYLRCHTNLECPGNLDCVDVGDSPSDPYPWTKFCVP